MFGTPKRKKPPNQAAAISQSVAGVSRRVDKLVSILQDTSASPGDRIAACEVIRSLVEFQSISSIPEIWYSAQPLLDGDNISDVRRAGWRLTLSCLDHDEMNNSTVSAYYTAIVTNANLEDFDLVIKCLDKLTLSGRKTISASPGMGLPFTLIKWMQLLLLKTQDLRNNSVLKDPAEQAGGTTCAENFHALLEFCAKCLKFNMHVWDPSDIEKLLLSIVAIVKRTSDITDCKLSCQLVEMVIAYGLVPATVLQPLLEVLCALISLIPEMREQSKSIIASIMSSHLQSVACARFCAILDSPTADISLPMRSAAARELTDFLVYKDAEKRESKDGSSSADSVIAVHSLIVQKQYTDAFIDISIPIYEVLDAFDKTLHDPATPLSLVVTLLDCFLVLITKMGIMQRLYASSVSKTGSPADIIDRLSRIYAEHTGTSKPALQPSKSPLKILPAAQLNPDEEKTLIKRFYSQMRVLAGTISGGPHEKLGTVDPYEQIYSCLSLSRFLDQQACKALLTSIDSLQFCIPGINGWLDRVHEVLDRLYSDAGDAASDDAGDASDADSKRELSDMRDECRVEVLRIVREVYALDPLNEDWISVSELKNLTNKLFSVFEDASPKLMADLQSFFETQVFSANEALFASICSQLATVAITSSNERAALGAVDALIQAFSRSFLLYEYHSKLIITTLVSICRETLNNPSVFARSYSVVSRLRINIWDKLLLVTKTSEPSYGRSLMELQEPLPLILQNMQSRDSLVITLGSSSDSGRRVFSILPVLELGIEVLKEMKEVPERTLALVLMNSASLISNYRIFDIEIDRAIPLLQDLREILLLLVGTGGANLSRNMNPSVKQGCICAAVHILTCLLPCDALFFKADHDRLVHTLVLSISQSVATTGWAVNCFTLGCYECPSSVQKYLPQILSQLQLKITNRECSMYILDFLLSLALEGSLTKNFTEQDYKRVFGMCFSFIQNAHDWLHRVKSKGDIAAQWLIRLAYSAVENLFLSIPLRNRKSLVSFIIRNLILANHDPTSVDPTSLVVYDMVNMFAYSDVPSRVYMDPSRHVGGEWEVKRWLRGIVVTEIQTNKRTGDAVRIIRRPAGVITTRMKPALSDYEVRLESELEVDESMPYSANYYFLCGQLSLATFPKVVPATDEASSANSTLTPTNSVSERSTTNSIVGQDMSSTKRSTRSVPISIPDDPQTNRAISALDRVPIVDFYKVGIIYIAPGQTTEHEILGNSSGSAEYRRFLETIGSLIKLKNNKFFYVGGLDTSQDLDGKYAIAWSSKIQQIIFHTITMMPAVAGDEQFSSKKRHIGNDFVNIYFDESGADFEFDVVQSQFNFIQIVITPANFGLKRYWKVRAYRKEGMKNTLAAYETKVVQDCNLALFVRNLCLKASQYAAIHNLGGEYMDNWVYRLQLIEQLTERVTKLDTASTEQSEQESITELLDFEGDEPEIALAGWMDFSRYTN